MNTKFVMAIHGGAGTVSRNEMTSDLADLYLDGLRTALLAGVDLLLQGRPALDAVEAAVMELENCVLFNAGKGAVFNDEGKHEMDAALMDGKDLRAGAVCGISRVKNPIRLARAAMEKTRYVLVNGAGAEQLATEQGLDLENAAYFYSDHRHKEWSARLHDDTIPSKKIATVGAVALDVFGDLAAATSTGGLTGKKYGRVGDSPLIGAGTYANNKTCAVSCTGDGEQFIRSVFAYDISCLMEYKNMPLREACHHALRAEGRWASMGGSGGLIAVDRTGEVVMPFNTEGMYRASWSADGKITVDIF
jgi:beta-aspartyl-peptidase (threonine type)